MKIDRTDKRILNYLQQHGRASILEVADAVGLSATPCARRVKQLESSGIIRGHMALLDEQKLGLTLTALISISMDRHTPDRFEKFEEAIQRFDEIVECNLITGQSADYLVKAVLPDMAHYEAFLLGKLTKIEGVTGVHSSFILRKVKANHPLPLEQLNSD